MWNDGICMLQRRRTSRDLSVVRNNAAQFVQLCFPDDH